MQRVLVWSAVALTAIVVGVKVFDHQACRRKMVDTLSEHGEMDLLDLLREVEPNVRLRDRAMKVATSMAEDRKIIWRPAPGRTTRVSLRA